ncbi:DinB family protein [Pseudomonas sp. GD04087]|uniref:DinB family protein n=1 Tax=unclassified Pseudomonas TaxID=196821 RepID=UPI00244BA781|nr:MULTISPECIES: DinB family protein [unclassified Pseudomonas]MDH0289887.1 DinB family protein [Pseudomonas sp. GD04087]MDH1050162.1 DinB family protein [Pseudomonas sp. GD03903]MDH2002042.1 DinB family protein [Pseudomonas sp. GD03691]
MLTQAFAYKCWSDRRTLDAVALIDRERFPAEHAFALQQLNHMAIVEELFRARLNGEADPHPATNTATLPGYDELRERLLSSTQWYVEQLAALTPAQGREVIRFRFTDGRSGSLTREEMFFHILNHATYHRGSIARALDQAGVAHPADTYTVFVHATQPQRRES